MDPKANVLEQLSLARKILKVVDGEKELELDDAVRLAELVLAYYDWKRKGGFSHD